MKVSFLGGGNMANALIGGLIKTGTLPSDINVIEISDEARARLIQSYQVACHAGASPEALACDILVLAIKPQQMPSVLPSLTPFLSRQTIVSIAAGVRIPDISRWLGNYRRLVRAMPNTPALIGAGITGLYALPEIDANERAKIDAILRTVGNTLWVDDETRIDAITAVSGSGPAYIFYFIEALQAAAVQMGLTPDEGKKLAIDTALGAARLAEASSETVSLLRERVTSPGGTTEAALNSMRKDQIGEGIVRAALAAEARSRELGQLLGRDG